ncbi:MAG: DUF3987 domain-containing protein [Bacteroidota bacterium]
MVRASIMQTYHNFNGIQNAQHSQDENFADIRFWKYEEENMQVVFYFHDVLKGSWIPYYDGTGVPEKVLKSLRKSKEPKLTPEQQFKEEFTLENAPEIPLHIYAALPPFFKELCETFTESHEKAVFLTAALPIAAAQMPNAITRNADRFHTLDFYTAIVARAGSGKGKAEFAFRLASVTDAYILKNSQDKFQQWKNENALQERKKGNQKSDNEKPLEPMPIVRGLVIPANTPSTPFIRKLKANGGRGLIKESEIDVLNGTIKQDWGALIDPLLRQAFHHETYSLSRTQTKDSEESESRIENPQLSVVLTGTENQMIRLLGKGGIENGLYSRFAIYYLEAPNVWQSRRPSVKFDKREQLFKIASEKLFQLWQMLRVHQSLEIKLTDSQFDLIDSTFAALRSEWSFRNHDISIITQRSALIAQRIIGILTVLRNIDRELYKTDELIPIDTDAQTGVELAVIYFEHAARFAVSKLNSKISDNAGKRERAFDLKTQGISNREISRILEISHTHVNNWFKNGNSGNSGNYFPLSTEKTKDVPNVPEFVEPIRSTPEPENVEFITTDELNEGFFGKRETAKYNVLKTIMQSRNISGSEAGKVLRDSLKHGLLKDTRNDTFLRTDM